MTILTAMQQYGAVILFFLLVTITKVPAVEYEVDGQLEQTIYKWDYSVATFHQYQFTVYVRDCAWLIRATVNGANGKPVSASETACVNGTEIYQLSGPVDGTNAVIGRRSGSVNGASIVSNNVPIGETERYFVNHIWLMYASGCYFQNRTNNWLAPVYSVNASAMAEPYLKVITKWELLDGPGSLPKSVTYYRDQNSGIFQNNNPIEATYTATGITNAGSIKIPSGFVFEWIRGPGRTVSLINPTNPPVIDQHAATNSLRKRTVDTVTAVRPYCSRKGLTPKAIGGTMVNDLRPLQEVWSPTLPTNPAEWLIQHGLWDGKTNNPFESQPTNIPAWLFTRFSPTRPPTNHYHYIVQDGVKWLPLAKAKKAYVESQRPAKPIPRGIVAAVLLLPTALFASVWLLTRKRA
jgi:hypothetical protein